MKTKKPRSDVSPCIAARRGASALGGLRTAERSSGRDSQGAESKRALAGCQPLHTTDLSHTESTESPEEKGSAPLTPLTPCETLPSNSPITRSRDQGDYSAASPWEET